MEAVQWTAETVKRHASISCGQRGRHAVVAPEGIPRWFIHPLARGIIAGLHTRKRLWTEFRDLLLKLGADETALALYRAEPALRSRRATEQGYLREIQTWQPALADLPAEKPDLAKDPTQRVSFSQEHSQIGSSRTVRFDGRGDAWEAVWREGSLASLDHRH